MLKNYLLAFILLIVLGCQQETYEWNPIFEETDFGYFQTNIERSLALINDASSEANTAGEASIQEKLQNAKNGLLEIKDYYIPLTTVRQNVYDAERYFKLSNIKKSEKLLNDSKSIITALNLTTKNKVFDQVILDLNSRLNAVIISLDEKPSFNTYNKFKILGEHVNLMLYRGDLVLSGIEFDK